LYEDNFLSRSSAAAADAAAVAWPSVQLVGYVSGAASLVVFMPM